MKIKSTIAGIFAIAFLIATGMTQNAHSFIGMAVAMQHVAYCENIKTEYEYIQEHGPYTGELEDWNDYLENEYEGCEDFTGPIDE